MVYVAVSLSGLLEIKWIKLLLRVETLGDTRNRRDCQIRPQNQCGLYQVTLAMVNSLSINYALGTCFKSCNVGIWYLHTCT